MKPDLQLKILLVSNSKFHKKVYDRLSAALSVSDNVTLFCYEKGFVSPSPLLEKVRIVSVGKPKDSSYLDRIFYSIKMAAALLCYRIKYGPPDVVIANTAEHMLISSLILSTVKRKLYDLADLNPLQYNLGLSGRFFRLLERVCLRRVEWTCVVTSPWFYWHYFVGMLGVSLKSVLIENKLSERYLPVDVCAFEPKSRIVIAWTGILRCNKSLEMLIGLTDQFPGQFLVKLVGVTDLLDAALVRKVKANNSFVFVGRYEPNQLREKLVGCNFIWCGDFTDGLNSNVLLPNRLYQAVAFGIPLLVPTSSVLSKICDKFEIGVKYDPGRVIDLFSILEEQTQEQYLLMRKNCLALSSSVVRGDEWKNVIRFDSDLSGFSYLPESEDLKVIFR